MGGGTENQHVFSTHKLRAKKAFIKQDIVCHFVSFALRMHTCAFFTNKVTQAVQKH